MTDPMTTQDPQALTVEDIPEPPTLEEMAAKLDTLTATVSRLTEEQESQRESVRLMSLMAQQAMNFAQDMAVQAILANKHQFALAQATPISVSPGNPCGDELQEGSSDARPAGRRPIPKRQG